MFSQTLGAALGDWTAVSAGMGHLGGMAIFAGLLAIVAAACRWTRVAHTALFWAAFVLTRPLGAARACARSIRESRAIGFTGIKRLKA